MFDVFISHSHRGAAIANRLEDLLIARFGQNLEIFNTSRYPISDESPVTDNNNDGTRLELPVDGVKTEAVDDSTAYLAPGVYVEESEELGSSMVVSTLRGSLSKSSTIVVILTENSSKSPWVVWKARRINSSPCAASLLPELFYPTRLGRY